VNTVVGGSPRPNQAEARISPRSSFQKIALARSPSHRLAAASTASWRSCPLSASRSLPEAWCTRPTTSAIGVTTSPTTSRSLASVSMASASADRASSSWRSSRRDLTHSGTATATAPAVTSAHPPPDPGAPSRSTATPYPSATAPASISR
jgi:hypothetical protein